MTNRVLKGALRPLAVAWMKSSLRRASRPLGPAAGPALVVAPHPDDETLGCGGYLAGASKADRRVEVVFLTDGEASHAGHPHLTREVLARRRPGEALAALACLGAKKERIRFWSLPDGGLERLSAGEETRVHRRLLELLGEVKPVEVLAPYREGGSSEHTAASRWVAKAMAEAGGGRLLEYPIWAWWNPFRMRASRRRGRAVLRLELGELRNVKRRALACHESQAEPSPPWTEPVLPRTIAEACCGPEEFFFASDVPAVRK